jgi:hypothetical protein
MEIGKPRRVHKVEPLYEPVPREAPVRPVEPLKTPEKLPAK